MPNCLIMNMMNDKELRIQLVNLLTVRQAHMDFVDAVGDFSAGARQHKTSKIVSIRFWHFGLSICGFVSAILSIILCQMSMLNMSFRLVIGRRNRPKPPQTAGNTPSTNSSSTAKPSLTSSTTQQMTYLLHYPTAAERQPQYSARNQHHRRTQCVSHW